MIASASKNGVLIFQGAGDVKYPIAWFNRKGHGLGPTPISGPVQDLRLSPDGSRAAIVGFEGPLGIVYICDLKTGLRTRLTFGEAVRYAVSSPDGRRVVYSASKPATGTTDLYLKRADGSGERELLLSSGYVDTPTDWTRDGQYLVIDRGALSSRRIWILPMFGDRKAFPLFPNASYEHFNGRVSPDGKWIAYVSAESLFGEVYVTSFPRGVGKWQIGIQGGTSSPVWGADGRELYFIDREGNLTAASIRKSAGSIMVEGLHPLFRSPFLAGPLNTLFDVDPSNGQRFLGSVAPDASSLPLNVVTNWTAELKTK